MSSLAATPEGARENAKAAGFKIVYDKAYPPSTTDFTPIVRAVQAAKPDLFVVCSYPLDTVGMVRAMNEVGFKPKMWGGAMVGLQATAFKMEAWPAAQRHRELRYLVAGEVDAIPGLDGVPQQVSGTRGSRGR